MPVIEIGEVKEQSHVKRLSNRAEPLHQRMIQAGEMLVLKRGDDRFCERDGAGFDRIARELAAFDQKFRKYIERVLDEFTARIFEMRLYERVVDLVYLRKVLFQIAWGLKMHNPVYETYYAQLRSRGMRYKTSMIAVARKFLRFLFAFYWKKTIIFVHEQQPAPALLLSAIGGVPVSPLSTV